MSNRITPVLGLASVVMIVTMVEPSEARAQGEFEIRQFTLSAYSSGAQQGTWTQPNCAFDAYSLTQGVNVSADCPVSDLVRDGPTVWHTGGFRTSTSGTVEPSSGLFGDAALHGVVGPSSTAVAWVGGSLRASVRFSGPSDVAVAVLSYSYTGWATGDAQAGPNHRADQQFSMVTGPAICNCGPATLDGQVHEHVVRAPLQGQTYFEFSEGFDVQTIAHAGAYDGELWMFMTTPVVTLLDASGRDVTSEHTIVLSWKR